MIRKLKSPRSQQECTLHPLIHTRLKSNLAQDMGKRQGATLQKKAPTDQSS